MVQKQKQKQNKEQDDKQQNDELKPIHTSNHIKYKQVKYFN